MKETGSRVDALAEGDLSARKESDSIVREIRNLLQNTSQMQRNLAQVIGGVQEVSGELLNSVRQVAEGSDATTEQAGQISQAMEQLSSAAEEMAEKVGGRHGKDHDRQQSFCGIREYHYSEDS